MLGTNKPVKLNTNLHAASPVVPDIEESANQSGLSLKKLGTIFIGYCYLFLKMISFGYQV